MKTRPKIATQTGIIAISSAAIPDGTVCSPQATAPMPPPMRSAPTMKQSRSCVRVGRTSAPRRTIATADEHHDAGDQESRRRHQERRDRLDRDPDPEVGRAPDDVEDQDRQPDERRAALGAVLSLVGIVGWSKVRAV